MTAYTDLIARLPIKSALPNEMKNAILYFTCQLLILTRRAVWTIS